MLNVEQIRGSFRQQLEAWQSAAQAFEVQAHLGKQEAIDRLEAQKQQIAAALDKMKSEVQHSRALAGQQREALSGAFENLRLQLKLGRAETRDAIERQEQAVREAVERLDAQLDHSLDAVGEAALEQYVRWTNLLKAEFEAASVRMTQAREHQQALMEAGLKAFETQLESVRDQLVDAQRQAVAHAEQMQHTLSGNMEQLRDSFTRLFTPGGKDAERPGRPPHED